MNMINIMFQRWDIFECIFFRYIIYFFSNKYSQFCIIRKLDVLFTFHSHDLFPNVYYCHHPSIRLYGTFLYNRVFTFKYCDTTRTSQNVCVTQINEDENKKS